MNRLSRRLYDDHQRLARVLDVLEREVDRLAAADEVDFDLMLEALTYITDFPNRHHHPVEDLLFARLATADPASAAACEAQIAQHEQLFRASTAYYGLLEVVQVDDATVPRDRLVSEGRDFIAAQREHMATEDNQLLPRAEARLDEAAWAAAAKIADSATDPLTEMPTAAHYRTLYRAITDPKN